MRINVLRHLAVFMPLLFMACSKNNTTTRQPTCNLVATKAENSTKVNIKNGVWGTVYERTGDCMPTTGKSSCMACPITREVRVYAYTLESNAVGTVPLYDSFKTQLIKTTQTDGQGFYQAELPDGKYTVVIVENNKLYASIFDGQGGISSVTVSNGKINMDLQLNHAVD